MTARLDLAVIDDLIVDAGVAAQQSMFHNPAAVAYVEERFEEVWAAASARAEESTPADYDGAVGEDEQAVFLDRAEAVQWRAEHYARLDARVSHHCRPMAAVGDLPGELGYVGAPMLAAADDAIPSNAARYAEDFDRWRRRMLAEQYALAHHAPRYARARERHVRARRVARLARDRAREVETSRSWYEGTPVLSPVPAVAP